VCTIGTCCGPFGVCTPTCGTPITATSSVAKRQSGARNTA
jgi:hypothetical protein